jgi:hypothetical protein
VQVTRAERLARIAAAYGLEVGSVWADVVDDLATGLHRLAHRTALTLLDVATRVDPDT